MKKNRLLYEKQFEHDACGVGFVADINGKRTNKILQKALEGVVNLTHRGAVGGDKKTGDGAGVLTQIPFELFNDFFAINNVKDITLGNLAVGMFFLPRAETPEFDKCLETIKETIAESFNLIGVREVPTNPSSIGVKARESLPEIYQFFISTNDFSNQGNLERDLYKLRKIITNKLGSIDNYYCCSFSSRTILYKGMLQAHQLDQFYLDLRNPNFKTSLAIFHQRYSTNTFPDWKRAHPFRTLGHNGEINTIQGNRNWMKARENCAISEVWNEDVELLKPFIDDEGSDSSELDNALELMMLSGRSILESICMLVPEAYEKNSDLPPETKAFYDYSSCIVEPWDGPSAIIFTDGRYIGAVLDRNGLRPIRYHITKDDMIVLGSEAGMLNLNPKDIVRSGRVGPGKILAVDTKEKVILFDKEVKEGISSSKDFTKWTNDKFLSANQIIQSSEVDIDEQSHIEEDSLLLLQKAFGYSLEDLERLIEPMSLSGKEPIGSMGDDTPIAVLSSKPQSVFSYFKQRFAQVTNPPIDPYREDSVMSLRVVLGDKSNFFDKISDASNYLFFDSPVLTNKEFAWIRNLNSTSFNVSELSTLFDSDKENGLRLSLDTLKNNAIEKVNNGATVLILSDRGISEKKCPLPIMLAVSAIHNALILSGKRMSVSIVVESGEVKEDHHICCLLGYGASAVNPYLAFASSSSWMSKFEGDLKQYEANYKLALERGILKVMSKMGISTVASYTGSQIFEIIGIDEDTSNEFFPGTVSRLGGVSLDNFQSDTLFLHSRAYREPDDKLKEKGVYRFRKDGEYHSLNPPVFKAIRRASKTGTYEDYKKFVTMSENRPPVLIRDLLKFSSDIEININKVEPVEEILKRFRTGAMSHGALSTEAHEAVAIAMNQIGGKSNSGEGGENPDRFTVDKNGDLRNSAIKQVASGRFGVTPEYLASAKQIEIKMAQGAKPGEGGQIPGEKVTQEIASQRLSIPGVGLISPPPHHDIYSIEDLAQLIYDLKHSNPEAKVGVKLVSEVGVGTVAAGVVKGYADYVQISGCEGGTGASPLGSIKHAGIPWEMGLAETQQVLVMNDLRGRVCLSVDGGFQKGSDVVKAAILGADEFGFGTSVLVALGCVMARQCHANTCPVGIASQKPELRKKFPGVPQDAINYLYSIASEVREILASIGVESLDQIIGRTEYLKADTNADFQKTNNIDLSRLIADPDPLNEKTRKRVMENNTRNEDPIDYELINIFSSSIHEFKKNSFDMLIRTKDRSVGAILSSVIAKKFGNKGLPDNTISINFKGNAGQSFGAYLINGVGINLEGEANDYVGKSMHGGKINIYPDREANFSSEGNSIIGNTVLYGATAGSLFAAGLAGERFCVRNSGALAVIEGVGDHACEYMTGGEVYIFGPVGKNLGAGMSGGIAYILNENENIDDQVNKDMVSVEALSSKDLVKIKEVLTRHVEATNSRRGLILLRTFDEIKDRFIKIVPKEISRILESKGINIDDFDFINPNLGEV
jgi:glutamate synthase domain-containing protein 2/glutamate synthase domain-containing protein 1/glutamate synthase domain-containing protein 3